MNRPLGDFPGEGVGSIDLSATPPFPFGLVELYTGWVAPRFATAWLDHLFQAFPAPLHRPPVVHL
jgi:hypothetical protein